MSLLKPTASPRLGLLFSFLLLIFSSALYLGYSKPAYAVGCPGAGGAALYICPNLGGGPQQYDVMSLTTKVNGNVSFGTNRRVKAGDTITLDLTYNVANSRSSSLNPKAWINVNSTGQPLIPDQAQGQWGGLTYAGGGTLSACPSTWFAADSNYFSDSAGSIPITEIGRFYDWNRYGGNSDGSGFMTCGAEGHAVIYDAAISAGTYTHSMQFRVNPESTDGERFCARGYLSVERYAKLYARSGESQCFYMEPVTISGNVRSNPTEATGKPFASFSYPGNTQMSFDRSCDGSPQHLTVDGSGNYSFTSTNGQDNCIGAAERPNFEGTPYVIEGAANRNIICTTYPGCTENFQYLPVPQNPAMAKSVNVGGGTDLKPGDTVEYTVTANNPYDSNSPSAVIEDNIPLNIDPNSIVVTSLSSATTAGAPNVAGLPWVADGGLPCSPGALAYGFQAPSGWRTKSTATNCSILDNPRRISIAMDRMPAYSQIRFTWRGTVKGANDIGFDRNGLQGVYNVATGGVSGNLPSPSAAVYNPIPGDLCIGKSAYIESTDATGSSSSYCETEYQNEYLYDPSPTEPKYNEAIIKLHINPDETKGPVNYYLRDPSSGQLNPKISDVATGDCTPDNNGVCGPRTVSWGSTASLNNHQRWPYVYNPSVATTTNDYDFRAKLRNDPSAPEGVGVNAVGQTFTNQASACIIQTWIAGWPVDCRPSNAITFKLIDVRRPFVTSEQGDIYAGGNSGRATCSIDSATPSPIVNGIRNNPGGQGWYMVTAPSGTISGFDSLAGYNGSAPVCRPDIGKALDNLISKNPGVRITTASSSYAPGTNDSANTGKVLEISGDFTIGDSDTAAELVEISRRWTIYVNGNLNIRDNIQYQDGTNPLTAAGSLGVVATGDINIAPWVTRLDGAYYAKGKINTCATAGPFKTLSYRSGTTTYPGYTPTECGQQLTINGVVLANSFRYNRTAQQAVGSYGEIAKLTDRLFLATPPGFSDLALQFNPAIYQGERRPRY